MWNLLELPYDIHPVFYLLSSRVFAIINFELLYTYLLVVIIYVGYYSILHENFVIVCGLAQSDHTLDINFL